MITKEEFLTLLQKNIDHIDPQFCYDNYDCTLEDPLRDSLLPCDWSIEAGATKAVFLIKGADYVVKIPFTCWFDEDSYQDALCDWENEKDSFFEEKGEEDGAPTYEKSREWMKEFKEKHPEPQAEDRRWHYEYCGPETQSFDDDEYYEYISWDYCNLESKLYQEAVKQGLGAYFAEEALLGYIGDHPVYYQTRCKVLEVDFDDDEEYDRKVSKSKTICDKLNIDCFNPFWIADFLDAYGAEELKRLYEFLQEFHITDLRDCNVGYLDGAPILIDYSGFREEY